MAEATGNLRFVRRTTVRLLENGDAVSVDAKVLQQEWQERWGHDTGPTWWEDVPCVDDPEQNPY